MRRLRCSQPLHADSRRRLVRHPLMSDLTNVGASEVMVETAEAALGCGDALRFIIRKSMPADIGDFDLDEWRRMFGANAIGATQGRPHQPNAWVSCSMRSVDLLAAWGPRWRVALSFESCLLEEHRKQFKTIAYPQFRIGISHVHTHCVRRYTECVSDIVYRVALERH